MNFMKGIGYITLKKLCNGWLCQENICKLTFKRISVTNKILSLLLVLLYLFSLCAIDM